MYFFVLCLSVQRSLKYHTADKHPDTTLPAVHRRSNKVKGHWFVQLELNSCTAAL